MRHFAQRRTSPAAQSPAATGGEYWPATMNPAVAAMEQAEHVRHSLASLLSELDERERLIITRHFGLGNRQTDGDDEPAEAQTLAQVAKELGISAERARQIEHRALRRLRQAAARAGLSLDESGLSSL
jgi:RNA polymerase sigma factor (sigma-70 family)